MLHKVLASLLALFTIAFCPAAFAGSYGEVQLAPSYGATYAASSAFTASAASATDVFQIYGSASKTIQVLKIYANGTSATDEGVAYAYVIKRSTANSGGTSATATNVPLDSSNAAATAVIKSYSANPTLGTGLGTISTSRIGYNRVAGGTITSTDQFVLFDADKYGQAVVLRGTSQGLVVNLNGVTPPHSPSFSFTVVFKEL